MGDAWPCSAPSPLPAFGAHVGAVAAGAGPSQGAVHSPKRALIKQGGVTGQEADPDTPGGWASGAAGSETWGWGQRAGAGSGAGTVPSTSRGALAAALGKS